MQELRPDVYSIRAIDWDRRLFDELIPLPEGTTYNAYLVEGSEKTALLDTVDPTKTDILMDSLDSSGVDRIDYVVSHHAEQDHSGSIPRCPGPLPEGQGRHQRQVQGHAHRPAAHRGRPSSSRSRTARRCRSATRRCNSSTSRGSTGRKPCAPTCRRTASCSPATSSARTWRRAACMSRTSRWSTSRPSGTTPRS